MKRIDKTKINMIRIEEINTDRACGRDHLITTTSMVPLSNIRGKNTIIQTRGQLTLSKCISLSRCRDNANSRTSGSSGPMMDKARSSSTSMRVSSSEMLVLINISKTCKDSKGNLSEINNLNLSMTRPSRNKCSLPLKLWHSRVNRGSLGHNLICS